MKMKQLKPNNRWLFYGAIGSVLTATSFVTLAASENYRKTEKELKIMSKIFETSLDELREKKIKIPGSRKPESRYLARQGMLFEFRFGSGNVFYSNDGWETLGTGIGNLVGSIANEVGTALQDIEIDGVAPVAPVAPTAPSVEDWGERYGKAFEEKMQAFEAKMEELEAMREQQREQREQVRDIQREIRDLERARRGAEKDKQKVEQLHAKLKQKQEKLNQAMKMYQQQMDAYRKKRDEDYLKSAQTKADVIISTLCDYGSTLRSLKSNEYVTLVFSNFKGGDDSIYVFKAKDVKDCENPKELLSDAISYQL